MMDWLVDYLSNHKRIRVLFLISTVLVVVVFVWREAVSWSNLILNVQHLSFADILLFYLYVGSITLLILMPFAMCHNVNNGQASNSIKRPTENKETKIIGRDTQCFRNKCITEDEYNNAKKDSDETTNRHTSV